METNRQERQGRKGKKEEKGSCTRKLDIRSVFILTPEFFFSAT
ncbi:MULTISPECIES: hypothetical protein [Nostocaceae]|nr:MULTISPECIES: hypothetical protein [Nostocaceae]